jgi:transposase
MSRKASQPERIDVSTERVDELIERAKAVLDPEDFALFERIVQSFVHVLALLEEKGTTIERLKRLFGSKSEKLKDLFPQEGDAGDANDGGSVPQAQEPRGGGDGSNVVGPEDPEDPEDQKDPGKGHGRNGAEEYTGAEQVLIRHPSLKPGEPCPETGCEGKVYQFEPLVIVRVVGQAPLGARVHAVEQLRCNLCLKVFRACSPEDFGSQKYDETAASMIAVLTYGNGMPFYRLQGLQGNLGIPLPDATQWDIVQRAAKLVVPAFEELVRQAAQGDVIHNDDTPMKILEYMEKKTKKWKEKEDGS